MILEPEQKPPGLGTRAISTEHWNFGHRIESWYKWNEIVATIVLST